MIIAFRVTTDNFYWLNGLQRMGMPVSAFGEDFDLTPRPRHGLVNAVAEPAPEPIAEPEPEPIPEPKKRRG